MFPDYRMFFMCDEFNHLNPSDDSNKWIVQRRLASAWVVP